MSMRNRTICGILVGSTVFLAGCQMGEGFGLGARPDGAATPATSARMVERDVEAPDVFSVTENGLWDGRPSLGGVWVAHPTVKDPERVIIRNTANGKFVIGALFRRERENPGPRLQVSSDAASALGMLAGAPTELSVIALRREEAPESGEAAVVADPVVAAPEALQGEAIRAETLTAAPVSEVATAASGAIARAEGGAASPTAAARPADKPADKPAPAASGNMLIQIGIFSVEANAKGVQDQLSKGGIASTLHEENWQGKKFWRVLAGPASSASDRAALLTKIKGMGYEDAYAVSK